jgi:hypothetical protein
MAWASYRRSKPGCAKKLRALAVSDPFPCSVVASHTGRFSSTQVERFRSGLIASKNSTKGKKMLEFLRLTGFESIPDDHNELVTSIAKTYPPPAK